MARKLPENFAEELQLRISNPTNNNKNTAVGDNFEARQEDSGLQNPLFRLHELDDNIPYALVNPKDHLVYFSTPLNKLARLTPYLPLSHFESSTCTDLNFENIFASRVEGTTQSDAPVDQKDVYDRSELNQQLHTCTEAECTRTKTVSNLDIQSIFKVPAEAVISNSKPVQKQRKTKIKIEEGNSTCSEGSIIVGLNSLGRWTFPEEVILLGVLTDSQLLCGGDSNWFKVAKSYNVVVQRYCLSKKVTQLPYRTLGSLKKHYRLMFVNKNTDDDWFNVYHKIWMSENFNSRGQLFSCRRVM